MSHFFDALPVKASSAHEWEITLDENCSLLTEELLPFKVIYVIIVLVTCKSQIATVKVWG